MARYGGAHKQATRQRILAAAGRRLKRDGIDGSGITTLMADAGLTNGAFYAHFESKDDLVATVIADQLRTQAFAYDTVPVGRAGVETLIRSYLSRAHLDDTDGGCPSAALLDEIGRQAPRIRQAYTEGARAIIDELQARIAAVDGCDARQRALAVYSLLVGTLQLARAVADGTFADEVLEAGAQAALALIR